MKKLYGTGVALVTPFDEKGDIDYHGLERLLKYTAQEGAKYYVVMGTTGEAATTTKAEKADILKFIKENNTADLPVVYGLGGNNTRDLLNQINEVQFDGVDAILSVSPYYNKPSQEGIFQHYKALADSSPVPVILYNVPGRTGSNISAATTLRLAAHKNIIGTKEASGNLEQVMEISRKKPSDFMIISGDDMLTLPLISLGAVGVISVLANPFAGILKNIFASVDMGDFAGAQKAAYQLVDINPLMYEEGNPTGVKQALKELGICENYVRLPLVAVSGSLQERINKEVKKLTSNYKHH